MFVYKVFLVPLFYITFSVLQKWAEQGCVRFYFSLFFELIAAFVLNCRWYEATDRWTHADDARTPTHDASSSANDDARQARHDATRQIRGSGFPLSVAIKRLSV